MYANQQPAYSTADLSTLTSLGGNRPQSTLESAVGSAHTGLAELSHAIDVLNARLQTVMAPSVPTPQVQSKNINAVEPPHSPAVNDLHALRGRLEALTTMVNDMTGRLEA